MNVKKRFIRFYPEYALQTVISESHEIMDASSMGRSVFELHPDSKVASDILDLVREVNSMP